MSNQVIAKKLKESTQMLCRQLEKKPAVEGNQQQVRKHKADLIKRTADVIQEMERDLTFINFHRTIEEQIEDSRRYEKLKEEERTLTYEIQDTSAKYKKLQNDFAREQEENNKEMSELKRQKNETQVEKDLHIQYMDMVLKGKQSCEDRIHTKKENDLQKQIDSTREVLATEKEVNASVMKHL